MNSCKILGIHEGADCDDKGWGSFSGNETHKAPLYITIGSAGSLFETGDAILETPEANHRLNDQKPKVKFMIGTRL